MPRITRSLSSEKVAVVTADVLGGNCWNWCESWINAVKRLGVRHKGFHVPNDRDSIDSMFDALRIEGFDIILLSGGDHHLHYLHNEEWKRDKWRELKSKTVCVCMEKVVDSPFPESLDKTRSAINTFDAFVYMDENADELFDQCSKPTKWVTQFSDHHLFRPQRPMIFRKRKLYFRGQLSNFGIDGVYHERLQAAKNIADHRAFQIHRTLLKPRQYAKELGRQRFVMRMPSNCPGWVENFWNAVASGCIVIHHRLPDGESRSNRLLTPDVHYLAYELDDIASLIDRANSIIQDWRSYRHIADSARMLFLENYTVDRFIENTLRFANEAR